MCQNVCNCWRWPFTSDSTGTSEGHSEQIPLMTRKLNMSFPFYLMTNGEIGCNSCDLKLSWTFMASGIWCYASWYIVHLLKMGAARSSDTSVTIYQLTVPHLSCHQLYNVEHFNCFWHYIMWDLQDKILLLPLSAILIYCFKLHFFFPVGFRLEEELWQLLNYKRRNGTKWTVSVCFSQAVGEKSLFMSSRLLIFLWELKW
jgi:hypothetical protein